MSYTKKYFMDEANLDMADHSSYRTLFKEGKKGQYVFNQDNWNSHQEVIIRKLHKHNIIGVNKIFTNWVSGPGKDGHLKFVNIFAQIGYESGTSPFLPEWYLPITIVGYYNEPRAIQCLIAWPDDRCKVSMLTKNGHDFDINEYIELCNFLELADFYDPRNWM